MVFRLLLIITITIRMIIMIVSKMSWAGEFHAKHTNSQPIGLDLLSMNVMMMMGWGEFHAMHTNRHRIGLDRRN